MLTRRESLQFATMGGLWCGWVGRGAVAAEQSAIADRPVGFGKARSVILIYTSGGQSQLETWDPKPEAPLEVRGEFDAISTSVPGTFVGEHMPRLARLANLYSIVRTVSHDDIDHGSASYLALTGHFHPIKSSNPPILPSDLPTYGAVLKRLKHPSRFPFNAVHINGPALVPETLSPGQNGGLLGSAYDPLLLGNVHEEPVAVPFLEPQSDLPFGRIEIRKGLQAQLDEACRSIEGHALSSDSRLGDMDNAYRQAYQLLSSPRSRKAFDLTEEPESVRNRYGRHRSGQACLLARRLAEVGVPWITVIWNHSNRGQDKRPGETDAYGWDTHNDIFDALKNRLLPRFDESFSALLEDLDQRGMLNQTLVVCMGEFGRAPLVALEKRFAGSSPGRKHWASVYSVVMAGAGVNRGAVFGESDRFSAQPLSNRIGPDDVSATMFSALGIDPTGHFYDAFNRPYAISTGKPIDGIYV